MTVQPPATGDVALPPVPWPRLFAERARSMRGSPIRELQEISLKPGIISFAGGMPADELFPIDEFCNACERVLRTHGSRALQYATTDGIPALREIIAHRASQNGLHVGAQNVLVTTGAQQALDLIGRILIDPGDKILVERPTYIGALQSWSTHQARFLSVGVDDEGLVVDDVEAMLRARPKFIYSIATFQNPTGAVLSIERRRALVRLAARHSVPIVEDDAYGQLRYSGQNVAPLLAVDAEERDTGNATSLGNVLYLGSFSKTLSPGLRVGWVIGPADVITQLNRAKQTADLHTSPLAQSIALDFLQSGFLDRHVERLRLAYAERRDAMLEAMSVSFPTTVTWRAPAGGFFVWVTLPEPLDAATVLIGAIARNVAFVPGAAFSPDRSGSNTLRLNFTHPSPELIREGIARLGPILARLVDRGA
jgi:2-aminoadipate transaminase